jgi:hypothetical protein
MRLKLAIHRITAIRFGAATSLDGTTLVVDAETLRRLLLEDPSLSSVEFVGRDRSSTSSSQERKHRIRARTFQAF